MSRPTPWRPQPPQISDPPENEYGGLSLGAESDTTGIELGDQEEKKKPTQEFWLKRARDAYRFSTTYIDSNYRKQWDDSIKAFNNQHASDSKYVGELFK